MICSRCGSDIAAGAEFCGSCGLTTSAPAGYAGDDSPPASPTKRSTVLDGPAQDGTDYPRRSSPPGRGSKRSAPGSRPRSSPTSGGRVAERTYADGDFVAHLQVRRFLGSGAFGEVYEVENPRLGKVLALKLLRPYLLGDEEARERLLDEGSILVKLRQAALKRRSGNPPNVVEVVDVFDEDDLVGVTMEYLGGLTLEDHIRDLQGRPSPAWIRDVFGQVLDTLSVAHELGIVHRDIKPGNIKLVPSSDGVRAYLIDFGIAKASVGKKGATQIGAKMGTNGYWSPEQIQSPSSVTARSDIFSLGVTLYELATGRMAFRGDTEYQTQNLIVNGQFEPPSVVHPGIDARIEAAIVKALAVDPAARFASCEEFAAALQPTMHRPVEAAAPPARRSPAPAPPPAIAPPPPPPPPQYPSAPASPPPPPPAPTLPEVAAPTKPPQPAFSPPTEVRKSSSAAGIAIAVGAVVLLGGGAYALLGRSSSAGTAPVAPQAPQGTSRAAAAPPSGQPGGAIPDGWVLVPGGSFTFGEDGRSEALPPFLIQLHEVTNAEYASFLTKCPVGSSCGPSELPSYWQDAAYMRAHQQHPVVEVTYEDANAYAKAIGARLPTTKEWEKAARHPDGRRFPWGGDEDRSRTNVLGSEDRSEIATAARGIPTWAIDDPRYQRDSSNLGILGLAGNVSEWTSSPSEKVSSLMLIAGGSWDSWQLSDSQLFARSAKTPNSRSASLGFRCVKDQP